MIPRILQLDPAAVAAEVANLVLSHLAAQSTRLSPGITVIVDERGGHEASGVYLSAFAVATYAITGAEPGDAPIIDYVQSVCEALYPRPIDRGSYSIPILDEDEAIDAESDIEIVILAALARQRLARSRPVPDRWLAALAGVSSSRVRQLVAAGDLARAGIGISSTDARRWLSGRGVRGIGEWRGIGE